MRKIIGFSALCIFSLINLIFSQQTCEEIIKSTIEEEKMITEVETNMLEIKKESDK